jgi:ABC-2 type transport system ATP-binding protein
MIVSRLAFGAMTLTGGDRALRAVFKTEAAAASAAAQPAASGVPPLVVDSLVKRFGTVTAVDCISLELRAGECFGLLGPNGAGKSTLIRAIASRVIPDSGRVAVFGSAALGWVPQELALYPRLTARENLRSFARYNGMRGKELDESVVWCLNWASLQDRAGELTRNLSGGMKRVSIWLPASSTIHASC